MSKFTVKKVDEIIAESIRDNSIVLAVKEKLAEVEREVAEALSLNKKVFLVEVSFHEYIFKSLSHRPAAQLVAFHVIETLRANDYKLQYVQAQNAIQIFISLDGKSSVEKKLDAFFSK